MTQKTHDITSALNEFRSKLNVPERDIAALTRARAETRKFLRGRFIPELRARAEKANLGEVPQDARIRFLTQGSFVYRTLNHPARIPPQQMDLDDGIYFRASDVRVFKPWMLLDVMESILGEWAKRNGWKSVRKPNCCRAILLVAGGGAEDKHIDWPLYAIRDDQMGALEKGESHKARYLAAYREWDMPYYPFADEVLLAHREEGWVPSDPRKVIDWAADMKRKHGAKFTNVCRYIKAWRDHQWANSPLTSITIMAIVARAFDEKAQSDDKEDGFLFWATRYVAPCLESGVYAPFDLSEQLDKGITNEEERGDIQNRAQELFKAMQRAIYGGLSRSEVCDLMRKHFGERWPPPPPPPVISVSPRKQWCN